MPHLFRFFVSLFLSLLSSQVAFCDVVFPAHSLVQNKPPGYCCWACLEMLGRNQKIATLFDLVEKRAGDQDDGDVPKNAATAETATKKLKDMGVSCQISLWNVSHLKDASKKFGAVVFMWKNPTMGAQDHAVVLTHYDDKVVRWIDPNGCYRWEGTREWFDKYWAGVAISLD